MIAPKENKQQQSVAGVVFKDNYSQVLLIKRKDVPVWVLPGGGSEKGESLAQSTQRELQEETGYIVKIKRKVGEFHPKNRLTKLTHIYECDIIGGHPKESDESSEIAFFSIHDLPKLMPPPYQEWIQAALLHEKKPLIKKTETVTYKTLFEKTLRHPNLVFRYFYLKWKIKIIKKQIH
jgi:8-oxo-dGTP diphosphatase